MIRRTIKPELTIINLIDVMMVLLVIFMLAAPTIQQWVDVNLPTAKNSNAKLTEGIIISITKDKVVFIDKEKIDFKDFDFKFADVWKKRAGEPVFIRADGDVPYKYVINIIGITKKLGGENVGLVVEDESQKTAR